MRRFAWFALGLVLLGTGLFLAATSPPPVATDFGWFAYVPEEGPEVDWFGWDEPARGVTVSRGLIGGSALGVLGLLVLATGVAYRLGLRRGRVGERPTEVTDAARP